MQLSIAKANKSFKTYIKIIFSKRLLFYLQFALCQWLVRYHVRNNYQLLRKLTGNLILDYC